MTPKQEAFVREYLIDLNATAAYRRAGYEGSDNVCAVEAGKLLRNPKIAALVQEAMEKRAERTEITADRVLQELAKIGFSDIRKAVRWYSQSNVAAIDSDADMEALIDEGSLRVQVQNQVELISSDEIDDQTAAAISEIGQSSTGALKVKLYDKRAALVDMGRHLGLFTDRVDVTSNGETVPTLDHFYADLRKKPKED